MTARSSLYGRRPHRPPLPASFSRLLYDPPQFRVETMKVALELTPAQAEKLRLEAESLGITPEQLAHAAVADLLATPDDSFKAASARVLQKNKELYRRLA